MNISCNVIRDLLPLYMEDMASDESVKLVDAHLETCESCQKELEDMKAARVIPVQTETSSLHLVKRAILKRWILTAVAAAMAVITLFLGFTEFMDAPIFVPPERILQDAKLDPDGRVRIYYDRYVIGTTVQTDPSTATAGMLVQMRMRDYLFPKESDSSSAHIVGGPSISFGNDVEYQCWYANIWDGKAAIPLFTKRGVEMPEAPVMNADYTQFYLVGGMLVAAIALLIGSRFVKRKAFFQIPAAVCLSLCVGLILHRGGQLVGYSQFHLLDLRGSLMTAIPLFLTILCIRKLCQWRKADTLA